MSSTDNTKGKPAGKIALVTGGSRGIGHATALALADGGADVVITYVKNEEAARRTVAALEAKGVRAMSIQVDLTGTNELERLVADFRRILAEWRRKDFDFLVNNAGILRYAPFEQVTEEDLNAVYQTNYQSVFFLTQKLLSLMADGGSIVNLASGTANVVFPPFTPYGPLKAALISLTKYLASILGGRGIRVNVVAPGGLDDDFNAGIFETMPQSKDYIVTNTALGRVGVPADVGGVIAFLCTKEASFITGATLPVDGGYHL